MTASLIKKILINIEFQAFSRLEKVSLTLVAGSAEQSKLRTLMQEMENTEPTNGEILSFNFFLYNIVKF